MRAPPERELHFFDFERSVLTVAGNIRIPTIIPIKGKGFINQGSGLFLNNPGPHKLMLVITTLPLKDTLRPRRTPNPPTRGLSLSLGVPDGKGSTP